MFERFKNPQGGSSERFPLMEETERVRKRTQRRRWFKGRPAMLGLGLVAGAMIFLILDFTLLDTKAASHCPGNTIEESAGDGTDSIRRTGSAKEVAASSRRPAAVKEDARFVTGPEHSALRIPVEGYDRADLFDSFQDARSGSRTHGAIDLMAARGTPVVAAAAGTIARLFQSDRGGKTLYIRLDDGFIHYYAHLERYYPGLEQGDRVQAGAMLGTVGSTGNASDNAPHLHFAIYRVADDEGWWQGDPVNPFPLLQRNVS